MWGEETGTKNDPIQVVDDAEVPPSCSSSSPSRSSRLEGRVNHNNGNITSSNNSTDRRKTSPKEQPSSFNNSNSYAYRGFSSSIGDMFVHPSNERVDCCAMVCCGIFQSDRDRYLLQGVTPPSPWKRVWVHIVVPIVLFCMAGFMALNIPAKHMNQMLVVIFLLGLLASIVGQCMKGRHKRMDIRKDVLWYKYQLHQHRLSLLNDHRHHNHPTANTSGVSLDQIFDQPRPNDDDDISDQYYYRGQTTRDIGCAHPCCFLVGFYPNDRPTRAGGSLMTAAGEEQHQVEESLCSCIFYSLCGRGVCGILCQLGGICGMAQESREIESSLLPPAYRRLDYVSMQPMLAYFESVYNQRWRQFNTINTSGVDGPQAVGPFQIQDGSWRPPLSGLSITILQGWAALTVWLGVWSVIGPMFWTQMVKGNGRRHFFSVPDYAVYLASWLVCLGTFAVVIYLVQRRRPLELSVDSMIKYFASGFVLSTTIAIFYEMVVGIILRLMLLIYMTMSGIKVVKDREYSMGWLQQPLIQGFAGGPSRIYNEAATADGEDYLPVFGRDHPVIYSIYLFLAAFLLAALVEEVCFTRGSHYVCYESDGTLAALSGCVFAKYSTTAVDVLSCTH